MSKIQLVTVLVVSALAQSALTYASGLEGATVVDADGAGEQVRLLATEPSPEAPAGESTDLAALASWIGDARVVALGESVHGTHTLHALTHRIFQYFVTKLGFGVLALEIDQVYAAKLDEYVQGGRSDLGSLLTEGWYGSKSYYDQALVTLLEWMRNYNQTAEDPIHIAGFDSKQPELALEAAIRFASRVSASTGKELSILANEALRPGAFGLFPNVWGWTGAISTPIPEPSEPRDILLEVRVRAEGLEYGSAGVVVSWNGKRQQVLNLESRDVGSGWAAHQLEIDALSGGGTLEVALYHRGNGSVWFDRPVLVLGESGTSERLPLDEIKVRPLMMPKLQRMDYRHDSYFEKDLGREVLRVVADSTLDQSLSAMSEAERLMGEVLELQAGELVGTEVEWARQTVRLAAQAVHWRTLLETNRDVHLAENLRWLADVAFSGRRVLALGHTSHIERRPGRMGSFLAEALAEEYRAVSMLAGAGSYRYFGDVASLAPNPPLQEFKIDPEDPRNLAGGSFRRSQGGSYLVSLLPGDEPSRQERTGTVGRSREIDTDIVIFVELVEPLRDLEP